MRTLEERQFLLRKLRLAIECYEKDIAKALYDDLGKCEMEAYSTEIGFIYSSISYFQKHLGDWMSGETKRVPIYIKPATSEIRYEPYGKVLIIGPFNYPFQLIMEPLIGAISAGNDVVVKPSPLAPHTEKVIDSIIKETFKSEEVICVTGGYEETERLLQEPFDYIFFTGSAAFGKKVMAMAAENLTPITLELGGKSPVVVCDDIDLEIAAKRIIWGKIINAGQTCVAPDYVLVNKCKKGELIVEMEKAIKSFLGRSGIESKSYGRIINERHFDRLEGILQKDEEFIICGGKRDRHTLFIEPTILDLDKIDVMNTGAANLNSDIAETTNVASKQNGMKDEGVVYSGMDKFQRISSAAMQEEIFGPILPIISYDNEAELLLFLERAEKSFGKPLALYIFSEDEENHKLLIENVQSGGVCINDTLMHLTSPELPFGGVGNSGMGSYHGKDSFLTFSHKRSIMKRGTKISNDIIYPPYNRLKLALIKKFMK